MSHPEGMNERGEITFTPDNLIQEPIVFLGLTDTEVVALSVTNILIWVPISVLLLLPFGFALFGIGVGFALALGSVYIASLKLKQLKKKLPDGLHMIVIQQWLQDRTPLNYGYIKEDGSWSIRRHTKTPRFNEQNNDDELDAFESQCDDLSEYQAKQDTQEQASE